MSYHDGSGGGLLGSVLLFAANAALRSRASQKADRRNEKTDLLGSTVCQYGKKDENGFTQSCAGCLVRRYCTRAQSIL
ncbi:MAG: hypothetical protein II705_03810 [Clostridia bacterium]|nr:hypothetical protein [Clostridia bacterium]